MKTLIIIITLLINITASQGSFTYLGEDGAQFKSYDNEVWWYLEYAELGFIPEQGKTYTIIYDTNGTEEESCPHDYCDNCWREDDTFIAIALGSNP